MTLAIFLISLFFELLALFCVIFWTIGIIEGLHHDRRGTLKRSFVTSLETRGFLTIIAVTCVPFPSIEFYSVTRVPPSIPLSINILLLAALVLFACSIVLAGITLFLRLRPKQPAYRFHLPGDAEKVRIQGCKDGIRLAATTYPTEIPSSDLIDTFSRAQQVSMRENVFPQGKRAENQLTNDFAVYCDLRAEGCVKGYYGLIEQSRTLPDQFEGILTQLQQGDPTSEEIHTLLQTLVQQILYGEEESTGE